MEKIYIYINTKMDSQIVGYSYSRNTTNQKNDELLLHRTTRMNFTMLSERSQHTHKILIYSIYKMFKSRQYLSMAIKD